MNKSISDAQNNNNLPSTDLSQLIQSTLEDYKALDIQNLFIGDISSVADHMVVASGNSKRHVQSIAQNLVEASKAKAHKVLGVEGLESGEWVLVDLGDVIVHIMQPETRAFYDLEKLWKVRPSHPQQTTPA